MTKELEKQIAWQNINTSFDKLKVLSGKAVAIETEQIELTDESGKKEKENINCLIVNFKNIKVLIPSKELGTAYENKKELRNLIGSEIKFIIIEIDKTANIAVASRIKAMEKIRNIELKKYEIEDIVYAKVISVYNKSILVECLGFDITLGIQDLEYGYVADLNNLYQVGDKIKVKIKKIDKEKNILKISHKEVKEDPYKNIRKSFTEGGEYLAEVTGFSDNRDICKFKARS